MITRFSEQVACLSSVISSTLQAYRVLLIPSKYSIPVTYGSYHYRLYSSCNYLSSHRTMLSKTAPFLVALIARHVLSAPYPLPNSTICNETAFLCPSNPNKPNPGNPAPLGSGEYVCHEVYPADLTVLNSRYPDYDVDHLHAATQLFMLRRQIKDTGEIATQVQFRGLPNSTSNYTCRLEFVLPRVELQRISGPNPSFDVYQVKQAAETLATWNTYESEKDGVLPFGTVNGENQALERTRSVGGVAAVNSTQCNETLTFQMGMMYDSPYAPNYWQFLNAAPPAFPVQGFRVVYGC
jgi:hypothetical protein